LILSAVVYDEMIVYSMAQVLHFHVSESDTYSLIIEPNDAVIGMTHFEQEMFPAQNYALFFGGTEIGSKRI